MDDVLLRMDVVQATDHLLEEIFGIIFFELSPLANVTEQVAALAEFHHKAHVFTRFERVIELDHILVCTLFQDAHLLHKPPFVFFFVPKYGVLDRLYCN